MRLHWIDTLKGIGIILVVLAHHDLPIALETYIYSFHMPLFFFISGFLFDFGKYAESASNFVKGRFKSLIVPYFCFAVITLIYTLIRMHPGLQSIKYFNDIILEIPHIFVAFGTAVSYNPPLWFLTCLFVTELLFYGLAKKYYGEPKKLVLWLVIAGVIGYLYPVYVPFRIPWNVDVALAAIVFYGAGNLFRKLTETESRSSFSLKLNSEFIEKFSNVEKYLPVITVLLSLLYLGYLLKFPKGKVNMNILQYRDFFPFYLLAFAGIFTFVYLSKRIVSSKVLEYYGRNSLIILALHYPLKDSLIQLLIIILGVDTEYLHDDAGFALGLTVMNLTILVPVIYVINNYFSFILGKTDIYVINNYFSFILGKTDKIINFIKDFNFKSKEFYIGIPILAIAFAEILIYFGRVKEAIWIHTVILMGLSFSITFMKNENIYKTYQALMLLPLLRLVNLSMPVFFDITLYSFIFIYTPLAIPVTITVAYQQLTREDVGITFRKIWLYLPLSVLIGFGLGMGEYLIIRTGYLIPDLSPLNLLKLTVVMVFFVGFLEEVIFRSVIQTRLNKIFGAWEGILLTSMLFGFMHSGYGTPYEILYTFFVGAIVGYMFYKTRSLPLITLVHGFVNVFLFGVIPHLGLGLGLL